MKEVTKKIHFSLKYEGKHEIWIEKDYKRKQTRFRCHTSHSLWPWSPSMFRVLTATVSPVPGFTGAVPFSSIQPLKTQPNPPSPRRLSGLKFLVANLRSINVNFRSCEATFSSSLNFGVDEALSALLVVEEDTGTTGWSLLFSFVGLLSAEFIQRPSSKLNGHATIIKNSNYQMHLSHAKCFKNCIQYFKPNHMLSFQNNKW